MVFPLEMRLTHTRNEVVNVLDLVARHCVI